MNRRHFLCTSGLALFPITAAQAGTGFTATPFGRQDECTFSLKEKTLTVAVLSPSGFGRMELNRDPKKQETWPNRIELLIRLSKGMGLKELEGLTLRTNSSMIQGSRRTSGKMDFFKLREGKRQEPAVKKVDVQVKKTAEAMRISFAGSLLGNASKIAVNWVDFYR